MSDARSLADNFFQEWLARHPFDATYMGLPGFDDRVPDASEAGDARWRTVLDGLSAEAHRLEQTELRDADSVTVACVTSFVEDELSVLDSASIEFTVTPMPFRGPGHLLATASRTLLSDQKAAGDYLIRLRNAGPWIDQQIDRLRVGQSKGRLPVAPLVEETIAFADRVLASPVPEAIATPQPPAGWDGVAAWTEERNAIAEEVLRPAFTRWRDALRELLPRSRSAEHPGLTYIPGGDADYEHAIRSHTTLALTADELHQTGLAQIEALERRALELGDSLGLTDLSQVFAALRDSAGQIEAGAAMEAARTAVRRAEERAPEVFTKPLPAPCAVEPMPPVVALSGAAPHYSPPRMDGARPGIYWFNTHLPTAGTGWDLEGVAFHEAVPGHHLQHGRVQLLPDMPDLQRHSYVTVFSEGWALYSEQLAEEMGLYNGTEGLLGATTAGLMRAARLVLDTGIHAYGWSRAEALEFYVAHVPMPAEFLAAEIDRYIMWPGQALAYMTGKLEIIKAREAAQRRLGAEFSLPDFHAALLDGGALPIAAMHRSVEKWIDAQLP